LGHALSSSRLFLNLSKKILFSLCDFFLPKIQRKIAFKRYDKNS
jgi:hypothetical protein